jgi:PelA/Pel-15E family pectate lyase
MTAWGQQQDMKTLAPAPARAFEPASLCTAESVGVLQFLMSIDQPGEEVVESVRGAAAWLAKVKITGVRQKIVPAEPVKYPFHASNTDKLLVENPDAPALWSRLYEIGTNKPIYGDRDGKVHYRLSEISRERRTGYSWLGRWPAKLLETDYPAWLAKHAPDVRKQHK